VIGTVVVVVELDVDVVETVEVVGDVGDPLLHE